MQVCYYGTMTIIHCTRGCSWVQRGNQTGHCSACHRTFDSGSAFDAHQTLRDDRTFCFDPATVEREDGSPKFSRRDRGAHGESWTLAVTEAQRESLARLKG